MGLAGLDCGGSLGLNHQLKDFHAPPESLQLVSRRNRGGILDLFLGEFLAAEFAAAIP